MRNVFVVCFIFGLIVSCGSNPSVLSEKGKAVKVIEGKPNSNCEVVGKVVGENEFGSVDVAKNDARNKAANLKATHILIKDEVSNGNKWEVHALAYECP